MCMSCIDLHLVSPWRGWKESWSQCGCVLKSYASWLLMVFYRGQGKVFHSLPLSHPPLKYWMLPTTRSSSGVALVLLFVFRNLSRAWLMQLKKHWCRRWPFLLVTFPDWVNVTKADRLMVFQGLEHHPWIEWCSENINNLSKVKEEVWGRENWIHVFWIVD